jgi:hypothetical protein
MREHISHPASRLVILVASRKGLRRLRKASRINLKLGSSKCKGSERDLSRRVNCYVSYAGTEPRLPAETRDRLAE